LGEEDIYVIGGLDNSGRATNIVEVYNVNNNSWNKAAPLPQSLHHTTAASYNGKVYVVGGYTDPWVPSNKLFIYDPIKNEWQEGEPMPTARGALTANFINGFLYAVGGERSSEILAVNEVYDPISDSWTSKSPMPTARHHAGSVVVDGKLYVIGGRVIGISSIVNINVNEMYDPNQNNWISLNQMPSKRSGIAAAADPSVNNSNIYVFGGEEPSKTFNDNERYDIKRNKWTVELPMPTARHGLVAVFIDNGYNNNRIYVIGGGPDPGLSVSDVNEIFYIR
jgi:N-acetylneuraminic acid mutarotase